MKYNEIGKTGMYVSNLSFGASSLGGVFHEADEARSMEAVFAAVENGINLSMCLLITAIIKQKQYWERH